MKEFDDFLNNMIHPLDNPDFYALILADNRYRDGGAFSLCHEYDLGFTTIESYHQLLSVALNEYLKNMETFEKYKKKYPNATLEKFNTMKKTLTNVINNLDKLGDFLKLNSEYLEKTIGLMNQTSEEGMLWQAGWMYFKSHHLNPNSEKNPIHSKDVKHRLYLTVDTEQRANMVKKIIQKCNEKKLPYNFKVHTNFKKKKENQQSDTIVIYLCEENQVLEYVNFINDILKESPEICSHVHKPSPHLGIINNFIGYGFEPETDKKTSYSKILKESLPTNIIAQYSKKIINFLSDAEARRRYDVFTTEGHRILKPSEYYKLELESAENCKTLGKIPVFDRNVSDIIRLKKIFSAYFRRENMNIDELYIIRDKISKNMLTKCPKIPKNNNLGIDVDDTLYEMQLDEDELSL